MCQLELVSDRQGLGARDGVRDEALNGVEERDMGKGALAVTIDGREEGALCSVVQNELAGG